MSGAELREPLPISGAGLHVEGNQSARAIEQLARRMLHTVMGSDQGFRIERAGQEDSSSSSTQGIIAGRRPRAFWLHENRYEATRWSEVLRGVCDQLAKEAGATFDDGALSLRASTGRLYFSEEPSRLRRPMQLKHSRLYVTGYIRADRCVALARRVLVAVRGSDDGFRVEVADPP